ncbi:MAG TPA: LysE family translocator [Candidatus Limnocylindrales bacterium]|nr:LysE family translocator [Candidatus Limnocylindrales bacterium]
MGWLVALLGFAFVCTVTPGPNNILLWASGAAYGLRRSWPHVLGTALGVGLLAILVAAGLGALIASVPPLALAMKVGGSIYLLYLAWQVAGAGAFQRTTAARPMGVAQAIGFQLVNPKVWIFAVSAFTTFRPEDLPVALGSVLVALVMMAVTVPTALVWVVAGDVLNQLIDRPMARRAISLGLALLIVVTIALVWV